MKRSLCFFITACCSLVLCAQSNKLIDSLEKLTRYQHDTNLIKTFNELTWQYRIVNQSRAIEYGNKAINLSIQHQFYKGLAQAYNDLGIIFYDRQEFDSSIALYQKSFVIRQKANDVSGMAKLHNKLGIVYQKQGSFDKALEHQLNALKLFEGLKDEIGISYSLNNIAIVNQNMGLYNEAINYQLQSIAIKEKIQDRYGLAGSYVNVGNIYLLQNNYIKAREFYVKAVQISRQIGDKEYLSNALNNLSRFFITTARYSEGLPLAVESYELRNSLGDKKGMVSCLINQAKIFTALDQPDSSSEKLQNALLIAKGEESCKPELMELYQTYSDLYEKTGDYEKALTMHKLFSSSRDSLYTTELGNKFAELQTKYETLQKEKQIQEQQFALAKKNYWLAGSMGLVCLVLLVSISLYRRHLLKQEARIQAEILKQQEIATKAIIEAEEAERQRIAKDLHDGVGQMISAAKMNLSAVESRLKLDSAEHKLAFENIIQLVDDSCKEVRTVSHNMMPNALLKNSLAAAIREFLDKLDKRALKVHLQTQGLEERLDSNIETVLYRIIQECVNNVIKHAEADTLDISLIKETNEITATIEDNGKGFAIREKEKIGGIGLKNIRSRIEYLKGTVEIDSSPGNGTLIALHVPL